MKRTTKSVLVFALTASMVFGNVGAGSAKAKKPKLSKSKVTITVGKKTTIKVKEVKPKKTTWSLNKAGKKVVSLSEKRKTSVTIKGKKAGKATLTAKIKVGKKITKKKVEITVKKIVNKKTTPTPGGSTATPTPGGSEITATPTPGEVEETATPTPGEVEETATPTPGEVEETATPTPGEVEETATPTPGEVEETATPTPGEVEETATPTPGEVEETATPTPGESEETATPTPGESEETATPTPGESEETATPTPGESEETATPTATPTVTPDPNYVIEGEALGDLADYTGGELYSVALACSLDKEKVKAGEEYTVTWSAKDADGNDATDTWTANVAMRCGNSDYQGSAVKDDWYGKTGGQFTFSLTEEEIGKINADETLYLALTQSQRGFTGSVELVDVIDSEGNSIIASDNETAEYAQSSWDYKNGLGEYKATAQVQLPKEFDVSKYKSCEIYYEVSGVSGDAAVMQGIVFAQKDGSEVTSDPQYESNITGGFSVTLNNMYGATDYDYIGVKLQTANAGFNGRVKITKIRFILADEVE